MSDLPLPSLETISSWVRDCRYDRDAQVNLAHAVLALAEQQRIANKIAAAQVYASMGEGNYGLARKIVEAARGNG
jgi:hypothetical protein